MVIAITLVIILPIALIILVITRESIDAYKSISEKIHSSEVGFFEELTNHPTVVQVKEFLSQYVNIDEIDLKSTIVDILRNMSSFLVSQSQTIFSGAAKTFFQFSLLLVATFYFFKDGEKILHEFRKLSPLDAAREERILKKFSDVVSATMLGNFVTAIVQGILPYFGDL